MNHQLFKVKRHVGQLDQSQAKNIKELTKKLEEIDESHRKDVLNKSQQFSEEMKLHVNEMTDHFDMYKKMASVKRNTMPEYNILLMGESGAGKSLMINSIPIYLQYKTLLDAIKAGNFPCLIPLKVTVMNDEYEEIEVVYGRNYLNEHMGCTSYVFVCNNCIIRFINSPVMYPIGSKKQDESIIEHVLESINYYGEIHAIAIVLKSNQTKLTPQLKSCLDQLLTHLHWSATDNLIFLLTHSDSTDYIPGSILPILTEHFREMNEHSSTPIIINSNNVFCVDNKGLRYLVTMLQGAENEEPRPRYHSSHVNSANELARMLKHIMGGKDSPGLKPQQLLNTMTIYEAQPLIQIVSPILQYITTKLQSKRTALITRGSVQEQKNELEKKIIKLQKEYEFIQSAIIKFERFCHAPATAADRVGRDQAEREDVTATKIKLFQLKLFGPQIRLAYDLKYLYNQKTFKDKCVRIDGHFNLAERFPQFNFR